MDTSLHKLLKLNRGRFFNLPAIDTPINPPSNPPTNPNPPIIIPPPDTVPPIYSNYVTADFGENAINNHGSEETNYKAAHSLGVQTIFNYITKDFRDRCTSYESYLTPEANYGMVYVKDVLPVCKALKADIVYTPYTNASVWMDADYNDFVLQVASHYNNDGQGGMVVGADNNRRDITPNAETFIANSIAVSARRDTPELFKNSTSEGFGMEFFEDCSPEALDVDYPNKDVPFVMAEVRTSADGLTVYGTRTIDNAFGNDLQIGEEVYLKYQDLHLEHRYVDTVIDGSTFTVTQPFTPHIVDQFISASKMVNGVLTKFADVGVEGNRLIRRYGKHSSSFNDMISIGQTITLTYPDGHSENVNVSSIPKYDHFIANVQPTYYNPGGIYVRKYVTIGQFANTQAQSWAVPFVAGKLKVIKMSTGADWDTVRAAARATARRNPTGIAEIDNSNWDIYRGFGSIRINDAINYINNNN